MTDDAHKYQTGEPPTVDSLGDHVIVSPDVRRGERVPPGQTRTRKWPVLDAHGTPPPIDLAAWRLTVRGAVDSPLELAWDEFQALPKVDVFGDFHCVTRWSRLGNLWQGVSSAALLQRCGVRDSARFVILHGRDHGWTTNLPLEDFLAPDSLLADTHDGQPLSADHGGPVRAIVPQLYAWKSAKWLCAIELAVSDQPGYWERAGYHNHGDPWTEERFS